jgi:hypothetical protein
MEVTNYADELIKFAKIATSETTVDDFFDYAGIPTHQRSDFVFCAIMKQAEATERMQKAFVQADAKLKTLAEQCDCGSWPNGKGTFEFNNGNEKVCFDSWPCINCSHTTYTPGYYTDKSQFCLECSVHNCNKRWCQFSKKE